MPQVPFYIYIKSILKNTAGSIYCYNHLCFTDERADPRRLPEDGGLAHPAVERRIPGGGGGAWVLCLEVPGPGSESARLGSFHSIPPLVLKQLPDRNIMEAVCVILNFLAAT